MNIFSRSLFVVALSGVVLVGCARAPQPQEVKRPDFSGVWQVADSDYVRRPDVHAEQADYTPQAWANLQAYRRDWDYEGQDDPARFCTPGGMPHSILTRARDYVTEIHQYPNEMILFVEFMDQSRIVHFDRQSVPETVAPSNQGYSIGHFEGSTFVIETTRLKARNAVDRLQRSEQAQITERWSLRDDAKHGQVIEIDVTVVDPEVFVHPVKGRQMLKRAAAGTERNEYACPDSLWNDHLERRIEQRTASAGKTPS